MSSKLNVTVSPKVSTFTGEKWQLDIFSGGGVLKTSFIVINNGQFTVIQPQIT